MLISWSTERRTTHVINRRSHHPRSLHRSPASCCSRRTTPTTTAACSRRAGRHQAAIACCYGVAEHRRCRAAGPLAGIEVSVRRSGRNVGGRAGTIDKGLMIDLSPMKGIHVDARGRTVRAQGGVLWKEFNRDELLHRAGQPRVVGARASPASRSAAAWAG